jgi:phosphoacetylglucosamine mutase
MKPVAFRVGLLAGLLSQFHGGKCVGVMVTASHNPVEDNGIKLVDPNGEMVIGIWEDFATELANASNPSEILNKIRLEMKISVETSIKVVVGRDTRPSGVELCEAIEFGVKSVNKSAGFIDLKLQTTPQFHFSVKSFNTESEYARESLKYFDHFSSQFEKLLSGKKIEGQLVIDAANGIGAQSAEEFKRRLCKSSNFNPEIINCGTEESDVLNFNCGADFVKIQMKAPKGVHSDQIQNCRFASLDGDADRLIYFYFDSNGKFKMLDGDRISVLFAFYLRKLLKEANLFDSLKFGVVQTAYANGASTQFLKSQGISVSMACTGVKNLHHVAAKEYDIGVYFEANGHGTVLFSPVAISAIEKYEKLKTVKELINQCVGDAMSDLLLVEAILCEEKMSLAVWDSLYEELPSRQLKVKVADRSTFKTTEADTKLSHPPKLQSEIDSLVAQVPKGRAFVRPSGTEDVVRVYAEAETREQCDSLADKIAKLL